MTTSDLHSHCSTCVNLHCPEQARLGTSCDITSCTLECGMVFHSCKASEHRLLCSLELVACPSSAYGCPLSMPRARVAQHLSVCPASVVLCRHTHFPSMYTNPLNSHTITAVEHSTDAHNTGVHSNDAHYDFTQASSIQTQNLKMCNVNVQSGLNHNNIHQDMLHTRSKSIPYGENMSVCKVSNGVIKDLDHGLIDSQHDQLDEAETNEGGTVGRSGCVPGDITPDVHHSAGESSVSREEEFIMGQPLSDLDAFPPCYDREARLQLLQRFLPPDLSARLADTSANQGGKPIQDQAMEECSSIPVANHVECVRQGPVTSACKSMDKFLEEASFISCCLQSQMLPTAGTLTGTSVPLSPCGRDGEPHSMCGQLFRRDEFLWHSRNVHADLDLLERTCPLSAYGCPVVQRQLCALLGASTQSSSCGSARTLAHLVYDARLGAFGLRPFTHATLPAPPIATSDPQDLDRLSTLPMELLRHLLGYLDGFSLNQLALVSARMREVCASLLRARGMVLLRWTTCPTHTTGTRRWTVQDKVWCFSMAFSRVDSWDLVVAPSLSNHLQCCRWNQVERHLEARALPCMSGSLELARKKPSRAHDPPTTRNTPSLSKSLAAMENPDKGCR